MSNTDRDLLAHAYRDYEAAVKAARSLWVGAGEATLREAAADFLVHVRELRRSGGALPQLVTEGQTPKAVEPVGTSFPECPKCHGPTVAASRKSPRSPHFRCASRECDTPIWTRNGTHA
jgi:hypothetical protein